MGRRVAMIVLVLAVALFVYLGYNSYDARRAGANGDVFSSSSSVDSMDSMGKTKADPSDAGSGSRQTIVSPPQSSQPAQTAPSADTPAGGDSISPNPPDGKVFSGGGKYQVYRQGNLTWRLNTDTGQSCILFATEEEWKKPKVYRAGCRGR